MSENDMSFGEFCLMTLAVIIVSLGFWKAAELVIWCVNHVSIQP